MCPRLILTICCMVVCQHRPIIKKKALLFVCNERAMLPDTDDVGALPFRFHTTSAKCFIQLSVKK